MPPLVLLQSHVNLLCFMDETIHSNVPIHLKCQKIIILKRQAKEYKYFRVACLPLERELVFMTSSSLSSSHVSCFHTVPLCLIFLGVGGLLYEMNHMLIQEESEPCFYLWVVVSTSSFTTSIVYNSHLEGSTPRLDLDVATTLFCLDYCHTSIIFFLNFFPNRNKELEMATQQSQLLNQWKIHQVPQ